MVESAVGCSLTQSAASTAPGRSTGPSSGKRGPLIQALNELRSALSGRYTIEREIGHGGMATVYLARDLKHARSVAIKVIRPELAVALGPDRFLREIAITAELHHPNIVTLIDSGKANGLLYYVMPFLEGESLRSRLKRQPPLPTSEVVRLLRDVVDALAHAHRHGVVHRDIKPENVMIAERHAYVLDFGVAKAVTDATAQGELTTVGVTLGTPSYMAPEQAAADPRIDHRADIYAVGILAYELLAGNPPFGGTAQAVLAAQILTPPEPVHSVRPDLPLGLTQVVMKCLEKDPAARLQSSEVLLEEIESLMTSSGGTTPTITRPAKSPATKRLMAVAAVAVLTVVGAVVLITAARSRRARWVHNEAIPLIHRLTLSQSVDSAYAVAVQVAAILPDDSVLNTLWPKLSAKVANAPGRLPATVKICPSVCNSPATLA